MSKKNDTEVIQDKVDDLALTGATEAFNLGDVVQVAGVEVKLREFSAPEHALWESISDKHQVAEKTAEFSAKALQTQRGRKSKQQELIESDIQEVEAKLDKLSNKKTLSAKDKQERRRLAGEIDELQTELDALEVKELSRFILEQDDMVTLQDAAYAEMMWHLLKQAGEVGELEAFVSGLSSDDHAAIEKVMVAGKASTPLGGVARKMTARLATLSTGTGSNSKPEPPASAKKPG